MSPKRKGNTQTSGITTSNPSSNCQDPLSARYIDMEKQNAGKTYRGRGPQENEHGFGFEMQLLMLTSLNAVGMKCETFYIASGLKQAGNFDDVAVFYRDDPMQAYNCVLLQSKHSRQPQTIQLRDLTSKTGNFSLAKYFESYKEVINWKSRNLFGPCAVRQNGCNLKHVVLCSNDDLDLPLSSPNVIKQVECPPELEKILSCKDINRIKFYSFNKKFLSLTVGDKSECFSDYLIFALNFPDLDTMNMNLCKRLHNILSVIAGNSVNLPRNNIRLDNYRGWLINGLVRVMNPEECHYLDHKEICAPLNHLLAGEKKLIYTADTYRLVDESIFQKLSPNNTFDELQSFLKDNTRSVMCCCASYDQPIRWATAQIYLQLKQLKKLLTDDVIILEYEKAVESKNDLMLLASQNQMYIIIEHTEPISSYSITQFSLEKNSPSKFILVSPCNQTNDQSVQCLPLRYINFRGFSKNTITIPYAYAIPFDDFIKPVEDIRRNELLNTNVIKHLLSNPALTIIGPRQPRISTTYTLSHFSRRLHVHNHLDIQKIERDQAKFTTELFIFIFKQTELEAAKLEENSKIISLYNPSQEKIHETITTLNHFAYIHLIEITQSEKGNVGIWKKTHVNCATKDSLIDDYVHIDSSRSIEDDKFQLTHRITVLVAEPGMGKSYFSRWLVSKKENHIYDEDPSIKSPKFVWKILVELRDYEDLFIKTDQLNSLEHVAKFLVTIFHGTENEKQICEHFLLEVLKRLSTDHALIIILDGFDEISEDAQQKCIKLVQSLNSSTTIVRIVITTRNHAVCGLTKAFPAVQYGLDPIKKLEQINYLHACWGGSRKRAEQFVEYLNEKIESVAKTLLGTPLLCQVIAAAFAPIDNEQYDDSHDVKNDLNMESLNLIEIFDKFIAHKYAVCLNKLQLEKLNPFSKCMHDYFIDVHQKLAFYYLRPNIYRLWYETDGDSLIMNSSELINRAGITEIFDKDGATLHFIHRSFAEYFEAKLYISILSAPRKEKDRLLHDCKFHMKYAILCPEYQVTKLFLDSYFDKTQSFLFREHYTSIKKCWLFVPDSNNYRFPTDWTIYDWKSCQPLFSARDNEKHNNKEANCFDLLTCWSTSRSIENLQKLIVFAEFYKREYCVQAVEYLGHETDQDMRFSMATSLCYHLFLLPKVDRQHIVREIRQKILKEDFGDKSFELRTWLGLYAHVDKKIQLLDTLDPCLLLHDHAWLFNTVFPQLFSCKIYEETLAKPYEQSPVSCLADLLLISGKKDDDHVAKVINDLAGWEREMRSQYGECLDAIDGMNETNRQNFLGCDDLILLKEPADGSKLNRIAGFSGLQEIVLNRNRLINTLNELLKTRKENQRDFFESFFCIKDVCHMDSYLKCIEKEIIESIKTKCEYKGYVSPLGKLCRFFEPHFEIHLARLSAELSLLICDMNDHLLWLGDFHRHEPMLYVDLFELVSNLISTLDWAFPTKQMFIRIDIKAVLHLLCDLMSESAELWVEPPLLEWYKYIITLIQRCFDELSLQDQPHWQQSYTVESVCQLLVSFAYKANLTIIADVEKIKFVLHQTTKLNVSVAEIMMTNMGQFEDVSATIQALASKDFAQWKFDVDEEQSEQVVDTDNESSSDIHSDNSSDNCDESNAGYCTSNSSEIKAIE